jgi:hypothetical protein
MELHDTSGSGLFPPHYPPSAFTPGCAGFEALGAKERSTHAEILCRAHSIWQGKGQPDNSQLADWLQAEAEVLGES